MTSEAAPRVPMGGEAQFLETAIAAIHGTTERYAAQVLGVTPAMLQSIESDLIAA